MFRATSEFGLLRNKAPKCLARLQTIKDRGGHRHQLARLHGNSVITPDPIGQQRLFAKVIAVG
jgi:hypothetical protein